MRKKFKAMVLSCIDPRFQHLIYDHFRKKKLIGEYSAFTIAGAAVGVTHNKFKQ
jgi:carbonic anhydrase